MRIGILTFHFAYNYGAILQAYALSTYLSKCGHDVKIINYFPDELRHLYTLNPFIVSRKKEVLAKIKKLPRCAKQFRLFEKFKANDLPCTEEISRENLSKCNNSFDVFIVGSDQVWNNRILADIAPYFLTFVEDNKTKISYAASFGSIDISKEYKYSLSAYLEKFNTISVREKEAVCLLDDVGITSVAVVDPVFLLNRKEWLSLVSNIAVSKNIKKYIFYYILEPDAKLDEYVKSRAKEEGKVIIVVHPTCERLSSIKEAVYLNNVGPKEFLSLLINAEIVVTNSFHATAFAAMFGIEVMNMASPKRLARSKSLIGELCHEYNPVQGEIHLLEDMVSQESVEFSAKSAKEFLDKSIKKYE